MSRRFMPALIAALAALNPWHKGDEPRDRRAKFPAPAVPKSRTPGKVIAGAHSLSLQRSRVVTGRCRCGKCASCTRLLAAAAAKRDRRRAAAMYQEERCAAGEMVAHERQEAIAFREMWTRQTRRALSSFHLREQWYSRHVARFQEASYGR